MDPHQVLKPEQVDRIRLWIAGGAPGLPAPHWAFLKPVRPPLPASSDREWVRNAVDAFVLERLKARGITPAPEADRRTLARRLSLDLTGLPPTLEQVEAFVSDPSPGYYEEFVERLLASPHWGEHRGRTWLDAAYYADTHGLHYDSYREMWPYRNWVIQAFNRNLPYDRFITEQLAGDLLPDPTDEQLVATGFQRCAMSTNEGGSMDEEHMALYAADRVQTLGWVFLGLTANCAACHDHKFDPLTMKDFYSLAAFFRNTTQDTKDNNAKDATPSMLVPTSGKDTSRWAALPEEIATLRPQVDSRRRVATADFKDWLSRLENFKMMADPQLPGLLVNIPLSEGTGHRITGYFGKQRRFTATTEEVDWLLGGPLGAAPVITDETHFEIGDYAGFERTNQFAFGAWVRLATGVAFGTVVGRMEMEKGPVGWDLCQFGGDYSVHLSGRSPAGSIKVSTTGKQAKAGGWQHVFATYDGSGKAAGITLYVDGVKVPTKVNSDRLTGSMRTKAPLRIGSRTGGIVLEDAQIQDVRVYGRELSAAEIASLHAFAPLHHYLRLEPGQRTKVHNGTMHRHWLAAVDGPHKQLSQAMAGLEVERGAIKARSPTTLVQKEKSDTQPMARVLFRGQYDQPRETVSADTPAALNPFPADAPRNRLGLARWDAEQPLTSRVIVNRFWQEVFGIGLVATSDDFGVAGDPPANQELLDWLAVDFRENGWDVKRLFKLMVTSATYRQSAALSPDRREADPSNRLLSRGPRFRLDAEMVRDYALSVSGLLNPRLGGASVRPYQPDGIWESVTIPASNTYSYQREKGEALYRRSLYTFWKRSAPPSLLEIFNAPNREISCTRRERTNTPLQALATLNDVTFVEAARRLAEQAWKQAGDPSQAAEVIARRVLLRPVKPAELAIIADTLDEAQRYYTKHPEAANQLIAVGDSKPDAQIPAAQLAALTLVANQVLNLDEALNK